MGAGGTGSSRGWLPAHVWSSTAAPPLAPDAAQLLRMATSERVTYFGTSPSYLDGLRRAGVDPPRDFDLVDVRTVAVTGAPLSPATARFAATFGADVHVLSKSGGTDLCGGLVMLTPCAVADRSGGRVAENTERQAQRGCRF
jgi:acyl-coenzyme A synthetase/AMP-(fatty) acid ligase